MGKPNAEDGLVPEIIEQYKRNRAQYSLAAQQHTLQHAAAAGPSDSETLNVMSSDSSGAAKCDAELMCIGGSSSSSDDVGSAIYSNPSNTKTDATIQDNAPHSTVTLAESTASVCADVTSATMLSADVGSGARMYGAATWQEVYQLYSEGYTLIGCNDCTRSIQRMQEVDMNAALCGHESAALDVDTEGQGSGDIEQDSVQRNAVDSSRLKRKR